MKPSKSSASSKRAPDCRVMRGVRFQNRAQIDLIEKAAARRGWSFNAYVVRVLEAAVLRDLEAPAPDIFGVSVEAAAVRRDATDAA